MLEQLQSSITLSRTILSNLRTSLYLGDFQGMMEFFSIIGKIIEGAGFEDIVYQARL